jgi:hypothetical protein
MALNAMHSRLCARGPFAEGKESTQLGREYARVKQYAAAVAVQMMAVISAEQDARQAAHIQEARIQLQVKEAVAARHTLQSHQHVLCTSNNNDMEDCSEDGDFEISSPWGRGDRGSQSSFSCSNPAAMASDALAGCLERWQIRSSDAFARWRELHTGDQMLVQEVDSTLYDYGGR